MVVWWDCNCHEESNQPLMFWWKETGEDDCCYLFSSYFSWHFICTYFQAVHGIVLSHRYIGNTHIWHKLDHNVHNGVLASVHDQRKRNSSSSQSVFSVIQCLYIIFISHKPTSLTRSKNISPFDSLSLLTHERDLWQFLFLFNSFGQYCLFIVSHLSRKHTPRHSEESQNYH